VLTNMVDEFPFLVAFGICSLLVPWPLLFPPTAQILLIGLFVGFWTTTWVDVRYIVCYPWSQNLPELQS
jgi:hypothetical protein